MTLQQKKTLRSYSLYLARGRSAAEQELERGGPEQRAWGAQEEGDFREQGGQGGEM